MSESPHLGLGYLAPSQAQKHVTVNEALRRLDALVQLGVLDRTRSAPPENPAEGDRHIVGPGATGLWAGRSTTIAAFGDGVWSFIAPKPGWLAYVADENALLAFVSGAWVGSLTSLETISKLGVNAGADLVNRFAVASEALLFTHAGAGVQVKLNKAAPADTASLLYQTGFSGRAEFGLNGSDDFGVKVSPDGAVWRQALTVDRATGLVAVGGDPTAALGVATRQYAVARAGDAMTGPLVVTAAGSNAPATAAGSIHLAPATAGASTSIVMETEGAGAPSLVQVAYRDAAAGPNFGISAKARGTKAAPTAVLSGDRLMDLRADGHDGAAFRAVAFLQVAMAAATPGPSDMAARWVFRACPPGTGVISSAGGEIARLDHATGLSLYGANPVIDQNRHLRLRAYALSGLPAANAAAGQAIYASDLGGGGGLLVSDGAAWRRASGGGAQTFAGDADATLGVLAHAETIRHSAALTANRTLTLSAANAYAGARFHVTRTGGGAFTLSVGGLKGLAQNTWCEVVHDGAGWTLAAAGAL